MRAALLALVITLSSCWTGEVYVTDRPYPVWCENAYYPDARCDTHYVWVNQGYSYRGRWYGGRYIRRSNVIIRDHRRHR